MRQKLLVATLGLLFVVLPSTTNSNSDEVAPPICDGEQATGISLTTQKFSVAGEIVEKTTLKAEKVDVLERKFSGGVEVSRTYFSREGKVETFFALKTDELTAKDESAFEAEGKTEGQILNGNRELIASFVTRKKMVLKEKTEKKTPAVPVSPREVILKALNREQLLRLGVEEVDQDEDNSYLDVTGLNVDVAKKTPSQESFIGQRKIRVDLLFVVSGDVPETEDGRVSVRISPYPGRLTGAMEKTMRLHKTKEAGFVAGTFSFWDRRGLFPGLGSSSPVYRVEILGRQKELLARETVQLLIS